MKKASLTLIEGFASTPTSAQLEEELSKDRWDAHNIPGLRYAPHTGNYYINFTGVPEVFRPLVKEYVRFLLAADRSAATLDHSAYYLGRFFTFFLQRYPDSSTLHGLTEQDVDAYLVYLKAAVSARGVKITSRKIGEHVHWLAKLLGYLERVQSPMRPTAATTRIVWPHHYPRWERGRSEGIKYIPQVVLKQLDTHLQFLAPAIIPIVILLRASGWRISDVLYLKQDTCLEQVDGKYWLVGDIQKTRILGHRIPITQEVATVILAQIEWVKQQYSAEENPQGWLFPASKKQYGRYNQRLLKGDPRPARPIWEALNRFATKHQVQDEQGKIFHFKLHAFRHTKAVELLNNGMSLVMVQQWMAHASPEMTLIYAKILDETMRTQWEKTIQHGIVQFNDGRPEYVPGKKMLTVLNQEQSSFDPVRLREHRANLKMPIGTCTKTPKLICKFTELPCFHCPAYVLTPEDLPALEAYEQQILERIEIGKQANNAYWIEINQKNLNERIRPTIALLKQGQTVAKSDKYEREYTPEEWERRQAGPQISQEEPHG